MNQAPLTRLGDVCRLQNGFAFDSARFSKTSGTPLIRIRDLKTGIPSEKYDGEFDSSYVVCPGDLLIGMDGEFKAYKWNGPKALLNQRVCRLLPHSDRLDADFLRFVLEGHLRRIEDETTYTTVKHLSSVDVLNLDVALPPLAEQKRIAIMLNEQMAVAENARVQLADQLNSSESIATSILFAVFEFEVANTWSRRTIGDFAKTASGATPPRGTSAYFTSGKIPWIKTGELKDNLIARAEEHVTDLALRDCSLPLLPEGTLLIAMYGQGQTRGRTGLLAIPATANQACFAILPNPSVFEPRFLQYWFQHSYQRLRRETEGRGGNQPNLNGILLRSLKAPLPSVKAQREIADKLDLKFAASEQILETGRKVKTALDALPGSFLRRALSGGL